MDLHHISSYLFSIILGLLFRVNLLHFWKSACGLSVSLFWASAITTWKTSLQSMRNWHISCSQKYLKILKKSKVLLCDLQSAELFWSQSRLIHIEIGHSWPISVTGHLWCVYQGHSRLWAWMGLCIKMCNAWKVSVVDWLIIGPLSQAVACCKLLIWCVAAETLSSWTYRLLFQLLRDNVLQGRSSSWNNLWE